MPYVYITCAPDHLATAQQLSQDLSAHNIPNWFDDSTAAEDTLFSELEKSTHLIAVLSPQLITYPNALAAMEHARQQDLTRLAIRIAPVEALPPQLAGILPLNASTPEAYQNALDTLLEDLAIQPEEPDPELPNDLLTALYSDNVEIRRNAIQSLATYRDAEPEMRELAKQELNSLVFREQNSSVRALVQAIARTFDTDRPQDPVAPANMAPPETQAAPTAKIREIYLWQTTRWHVLLAALALLLSSVMVIVGGNPLYSVPLLLLGLVLPQFNIMIRRDGKFNWEMPGPVIGNTLLSLVIVGLAGALLLALAGDDLNAAFIGVEAVLGLGYGALVGWLSSLRFPVKLK